MNLFPQSPLKASQAAVLGLWKADFSCPLNRNPTDERKMLDFISFCITTSSSCHRQHRNFFHTSIINFFFILFQWSQFFVSCKCCGDEKMLERCRYIESMFNMRKIPLKTVENYENTVKLMIKSTDNEEGRCRRWDTLWKLHSVACIHSRKFCYSE